MRALVAACVLALAPAWAAARKHPLQTAVDELLDPLPGTHAYVIRDLDSGLELSRNADALFPLASAAKAFVALAAVAEVEHGSLSLSERLPVTPDLKSPPSGILQDFDAGIQPTVADLLRLSVARSDNTAADVLTRRIGIERIRQIMSSVELPRSELLLTNRAIFLLSMGLGSALHGKGPAARAAAWKALSDSERLQVARAAEEEYKDLPYDEFWQRFVEFYSGNKDPWRDAAQIGFVASIDNKSTAREMADLYTRMARGELVSERASSSLLDLLARHDQFGAEEEVDLGSDVSYAHKGGTDGGIRSECGVMIAPDGRAIVLALMAQGFLEASDAEELHPVDQAFLKIQDMLAARLQPKKPARPARGAPPASK